MFILGKLARLLKDYAATYAEEFTAGLQAQADVIYNSHVHFM